MSSPAVKNAISSSSENAPRITASSPDSDEPELGAHRGGLLVVELGQLRLEPGGDRDRRGAVRQRACSAIAGGTSVCALVDVGHVQHRLGRQRLEQSHARRARRPGGGTVRAGRPACSASISSRSQPLLGDRVPVAALAPSSTTRSSRRSACSRSA